MLQPPYGIERRIFRRRDATDWRPKVRDIPISGEPRGDLTMSTDVAIDPFIEIKSRCPPCPGPIDA
jgi:hypothetical protein